MRSMTASGGKMKLSRMIEKSCSIFVDLVASRLWLRLRLRSRSEPMMRLKLVLTLDRG